MLVETVRSEKEAASMKYSRADVHCKTHSLPQLRFEDSQLTSFSGLILIQKLFVRLGLKERLRRCFSHLKVSPIFGYPTLVLCLVVHLLLGYRQLRDLLRHPHALVGRGGSRDAGDPEAENDDAAKAYAAKLLPSVGRIHAVEVWQGQRRWRGLGAGCWGLGARCWRYFNFLPFIL
jgi:hypothetical protein